MMKISRYRRLLRQLPKSRFALSRKFAPEFEAVEERILLSTPSITEFRIANLTAGHQNVASGPGDKIWVTQYDGNTLSQLSEFNASSDAVTEIPLPSTIVGPTNVIVGPNGNPFFDCFSDPHIYELNPTTDKVTAFATGTAPDQFAFTPDGNLWYSTSDFTIGVLNPSTGKDTEYPLPNFDTADSLAVGPNGYLWFADTPNDAIGSFNMSTHQFEEYPIQTFGAFPGGMTFGPDGNLWFTEMGGAKIGKLDPATGSITEYPLPAGSAGPIGITLGSDGDLWIAIYGTTITDTISQGAGPGVDSEVGEINPTTDAISVWSAPDTGAKFAVITEASDGNLWLSDFYGAIGVVVPPPVVGTQLVMMAQPPANVVVGQQFGLTVAVEDASYNIDSSFNGPVTVAFANNPGSATLDGTLTATAVNGIATFTGLSLNQLGTGYSLELSADGISPEPAILTSVTSSSINVQQDSTVTTVAISPVNPVFGETVTLTATVAPAQPGGSVPTGQVKFTDASSILGTATLSTTNGVTTATVTTTDLTLGSQSITAYYGGDSNDISSTSAPTSVTVGQNPTTTTLAASQAASTFGQMATFTATVAVAGPGSGTPTGIVTFVDGTQILGYGVISTANGVSTASFSTQSLDPGTYAIAAEYGGDKDDATSDSGVADLVVSPATATLTFGSLAFTYNGSQQRPTVTTSPAGLSGVTIAYSQNGVSVPPPTTGGTYTVTASLANADYSASSIVGTMTIAQATPSIQWSTPANITYGTALSSAQLDASASFSFTSGTISVPGTFTYGPTPGSLLNAGPDQPLSVTFDPTDSNNYSSATFATTIDVLQANPTITWVNPTAITYGTALSGTQLNALVTVAGPDQTVGAVTFSPAIGTTLHAGANQPLTVNIAATTNYAAATATVYINVSKATPTISWPDPSSIVYGTAIGAAQLDPTASIPGSFSDVTPIGAILNAGDGQTLTAQFTPEDSTDYASVDATTSINVTPAPLTITAVDTSSSAGQPLPAFRVQYQGFVNGQVAGDLSGALTFRTPASSSSSVGTYPIVPGGLSSANYAITYVPGILTITPAINTQTAMPPVTVTGLTWEKVKLTRKKSVEVLAITFDGAMNAVDAQNMAAYSLDLSKHTKKLGTVYTKPVRLRSVSYSPQSDAVLLTLTSKIPNKTMQLTIDAALVLDAQDRPIDGNYDGQPGANFVALLNARTVISLK